MSRGVPKHPGRGAKVGLAGPLAFGFLVELPAALVIMVMTVHISVNAIMRAIGLGGIPYTLEVVTYWYMPILALLGAICATHHRSHIEADLVFKALPNVSKRWVLGVLLACASILMLGLAWFGLGEALNAFEIRKRAAVTPLPAWPVYFLVPLTFATMTAQFARQSIRVLRGAEPVDPAVEGDGDAAAMGGEPGERAVIVQEGR